jgi:hypothetical protein
MVTNNSNGPNEITYPFYVQHMNDHSIFKIESPTTGIKLHRDIKESNPIEIKEIVNSMTSLNTLLNFGYVIMSASDFKERMDSYEAYIKKHSLNF